MDDLQFRRCIYADPNTTDAEVIQAKDADPTKRQFSQDIEKLNRHIHRALHVPVPDDLANKLILKQTLMSFQQQKRKNWINLAMAASIAFVVGLTVNFVQSYNPYSTLAELALAHVHHEEAFFSNNSEVTATLASLNQKMAPFNGRFLQSPGELISVSYCDFGGIKSLHLVFKGESDMVTVFVMPDDNTMQFNDSFSDEKLNGQALHYVNANIVIIGDKKESLQQWQDKISENIHWSI